MGEAKRKKQSKHQTENTVKRVKIIGSIRREIITNNESKQYQIKILEEGNEITNTLLRNSINIEIPDNLKIVLGFVIQSWNNDEFSGVCFIHDVRYNPFEGCYEYNYTPWSACVDNPQHPDLVTIAPDLTIAFADYLRNFVTKKYYGFLT